MKQLFFLMLLLSGIARPFSADGHTCLACAVPVGLNVGAANGTQATLAWDAVAGANGYTVEVENTSPNSTPFYIEIKVSGSPYTVTGLLANQAYKFKVRSECGKDHSDWADWHFFNAGGGNSGGSGGSGGVCATPGGLNATVTATGMRLTWKPVAGVTAYKVEVENESPNNTLYHVEVTVNDTAYLPAGLLANQTYKFKVRSLCGGSQSDWSTALKFVTGANGGNGGGTGSGACAIPSGLNATATATGIRLSWKPVAGVTTYKIEVENEGPLSAPYHVEVTVNDTVYLPTGLSSNEKYKFKVRSICGNNQSDWSAAFKFATGAGNTGGGGNSGPCSTPGGLMVTGTAAGSVTLSWNAVAGAASYSIEVENASGNNQFYSFTTTTPNTMFTLTGLGTNLQYKFKVRTNCNSGHSDWSPWLTFNSTSGAGSGNSGCSVPTGLSAAVSGGVVTLSWNAVAGALTYTLEVENGQGNNTIFHVEATVSGGTYQPAGLLANKNYKFKVRANCAGGHSAWSAWQLFNSAAGNVSTTGQCAAPTGLNALYSDSVAVLTWNAVAGALSYRVEVEDGDHTPPFNAAVTVTGTTYTVTGLASGNVEYKFKVRANCSFLTSAWSSSYFFGSNGSGGNGGGNNGGGNGGGNCGIASGLGANALTNSAVLSWSAVPGAVSYGIEVEDASGNASFLFQSATVSGLSYTANGLMSGVSYKFKVRANCASGHGDWSPFFTFQTLHLRPGGVGSGDETANKHTNAIDAAIAIKAWPMPVQQELNLRLSGLTATTTTVRLYHPMGQLVTAFEFETGAGDWEQTLDLPAMTAGMYLLQVENAGKSRFVKVLKAE